MGDLNLSTVELITTLRTAPKNGSPSSSDYNEGQREILVDLASLTEFINNQILPLINALPDTALASIDDPIGLEGRTIWSDTSDQSTIFFDALAGTPLTLADSLRVINGIVSLNSQTLTDLGVEVASLQARLSSTNQNDIALALQNLTETINSIAANNSDSGSNIVALSLRVDALEATSITIEDEIVDIQVQLQPFTGDTGTGGTSGLVPAPPAGSAASGLFLSANGTFAHPTGVGSLNFSDAEVPGGAIDGTNVTHTLAHIPNPTSSLQVFADGMLLRVGISKDYTLTTNSITMTVALVTGTELVTYYRY